MDKKDEMLVVDIGNILQAMRKNVIFILCWGILGLIISLITVFFFVEPKYNSSIDILVNQKENNAQVQYAAQQADLQVINTYKDVLTKPIILTSVLKEVKRTDNYQGNLSTLEKSVKVLNQTNSQVITVSVTDKNAYVAVDVANTIGKVFAKKVKKMMQVDNVTIVSNAKVNTTPVSPNKKLSALIGVVVGLLLGILFAIVKELTDKTVKDSGFLTDELGLTNIGSVYHLDINEDDYGAVKVIDRNKISKNNSAKEKISTPRRRRV
ncbi:YveK family protein [Ligilactobacillus salivarius]|uniref:Capsular polysaccharide biosynthesis protein CpsC n=2 Tax=Ligilactobacillus salivarius TaxID=1624 RepID=V6DQB6_9LACO|nr:Wzz/FepE/Etk N-terminal domain-containing protein [Ligilactobacillus salivarius]CDK35858.1 Tyrosine-protein kinase transmembrane modulator EpsC [Ligilactobacillus salivarius cp400]PAY26071.1 chain-length determining protein [Ligilactobacillus salivarius]PAY28613.1 chain-length determining protein [Ligilactobacillus salivarius]PAY30033.1 chain-length determining protein [Ligilactobacillus salivarius]PAY33101.1 chain-length determining protein [Ligilactobacillus salivarius]